MSHNFIRPLHNLIGFIFLFSVLIVKLKFSHCADASSCVYDDGYNCDCEAVSRKELSVDEVTNDDTLNPNFLQTVRTLKCCQGSAQCKRGYVANRIKRNAEYKNRHLLCFSDTSCLLNAEARVLEKKPVNFTCSESNSQCFDSYPEFFNVSNVLGEWSVYKCFKVSKEFDTSCCLRAECQSFAAFERECACNDLLNACVCSPLCTDTLLDHVLKTYAIFLSFGDSFLVKKESTFFLNFSAILLSVMALLGLITLIVLFCKTAKPLIFQPPEIAMDLENRSTEHSLQDSTNPLPATESDPKSCGSTIPTSDTRTDSTLPTYDEAVNKDVTANVELPPSYADVNV